MARNVLPPAAEKLPDAREDARDASSRFAHDVMLRQHGFVIEGRPAGSPAVWRRGRCVYPQDEAKKLALAERAKALKVLEGR